MTLTRAARRGTRTTLRGGPTAELWQSREWTGEVSFIQGLAKYMEGPGVERVRYTCERYKLPQTTHVDVLSYYAIRNDWDPKHPASGIRNLRQGRYRVLEEFAKHGVDVTSEALRYPMIGKISCVWYAQTSETCPFGGKPVPLLPLIYGKSAIWGLSGNAGGDGFTTRSRHLFWNAVMHGSLRASTDRTSEHGCVLSQSGSLDASASEGDRELRAQRRQSHHWTRRQLPH